MTFGEAIMSEEKDTAPESVDPLVAKWLADQKKKQAENKRVYVKRHPERREASTKAYRENHKDRVVATNQAYRLENKERLRVQDRDRRRAERAAAPGKHAAETRERRMKNPEQSRQSCRDHHLKRYYGLSRDEFDAMKEAQDGRCKCCKVKFGLLRATWACVDHCHATGRIRGLLCLQCNVVLGWAHDSPKILRACARYLERANCED